MPEYTGADFDLGDSELVSIIDELPWASSISSTRISR